MSFIASAIGSVFKAVIGIASRIVGGVVGYFVRGKTGKKQKNTNNLNKNLEPEAFRKIVFGKIASPLDLRYWEVWGLNGSKYDEIMASAAHRINAYKELYLENTLAINADGSIVDKFVGILSRETRLGTPNQTAMSCGSGTQWNSTSTFDGCSYFKLAWIPNDKKMPNGIPSRYTQVIEGALLYDPRRDSTVAGGSGSHRINDQSTWSYATLDSNGQPIGRNNALQALWYLLGWRVQNPVTGEWELVCGRGVDPEDINLNSFIVGANNCEIAGYYTDMILSTEDTHTSNEDTITADGLIGRLIDPGGLWSYYANVDDTANVAVELTDDDFLNTGDFQWNEYKGMSDQFNQVSGKFVYPAHPVLYQTFPYPLVRDINYEANLGVKRRKNLDLEPVLDSVLAQRLARLFLNEGQYQGEFRGNFKYKAIAAQAWSVVRYRSERFDIDKLFRVYRHVIDFSRGVSLLLKEIHPSIWEAGTTANVPIAALTNNSNISNSVVPTLLTIERYELEGSNGTIYDAVVLSWELVTNNVKSTEIRYKIENAAAWEYATPLKSDINTTVIGPLQSNTNYVFEIRHINNFDVESAWTSFIPNPFLTGNFGNFNYGSIGELGWLDSIDPTTDQLLSIGSIPPSIPDNSFNYSSTTDSLTITWPNITIYRTDGTSIIVASGNKVISNLDMETAYKLYPFITDTGSNAGVIEFVSGGAGSPGHCFPATGSALAASMMYARGHIPMGGFLASTTSSGTGGGGGGGSSFCLHPTCPIWAENGWTVADALTVGTLIATPNGVKPIRSLQRKIQSTWYAIYCDFSETPQIVTANHVFYTAWLEHIHAQNLFVGHMLKSEGNHKRVTKIELIEEETYMIVLEIDRPHLYYVGKDMLLSHNSISKL